MKVHCPQCGEEFPNKRDMTRHLLTAPVGHKKRAPEPDEIVRRDDGEKVAGQTWYVVRTPHDGIMLTRSPAVHLGDEILSKHRKESAAEQAARDVRRLMRAVYEQKLNCAGKVAAHEATGEDVSDCDRGFRCGLRHVGACNPSGEDFDAEKFARL
jgi:uncharacterized C2H2 Zn-finger protein